MGERRKTKRSSRTRGGLLCFVFGRQERERQRDRRRERTTDIALRARGREREREESRLEASSHAQLTRRRTAQTLSKDKDEPPVRLPLQAFAYWRLWRGKVLLASPLRGRDLPGVLH